ncbi:hypothetical protein M3Y99_00804800 [Aphelenchoides fujianensis]|nr:hypothetical protein M3Y99_00804800 [Aphelenchoides fujianensis]
MNVGATLLVFCSLFVAVSAYHGLPKFYSNPIKMFLARPGLVDARQRQLKALKDEAIAPDTPTLPPVLPVESNDSELQKWKRRRASPIRISPFFYSMNPVDLIDQQDAASRPI